MDRLKHTYPKKYWVNWAIPCLVAPAETANTKNDNLILLTIIDNLFDASLVVDQIFALFPLFLTISC